MPLFECSQCHCIENTACSSEGWAPEQDGQSRRCSECADGKWHGLFPKRPFQGSGYVKNGWRLQPPGGWK